MNEIKELINYKKASGKTKEQLAYEIGISVFTVHRCMTINSCSRLTQKAIRDYLIRMKKENSNGNS